MPPDSGSKSTSRTWNYHPDLPLKDSSIFAWPPSPKFLAGWFARNWLTLSERVMMVGLSLVLWWLLYPAVADAKSWAIGWVVQVWLVTFATTFAVAGGLHWYFYMRRGQGKELKFEHRDLARGNRLWNFSDQVHDNMFWTLGPGVAILSAYQCLVLWAMANGWAPTLTFAQNPVWFCLAFILLPIWSAFHFYWVHRLLHVPILYRHAHALHHRNVNVGPWSGMSMHPTEQTLYHSTLLIHFLVPLHPLHMVFAMVYNGPGAAMTHTGYEDLLIKDKRRVALGTFYHQLHHRYYECNYGNQEMPWDKWFGTFHDGSDAATEETRARKKRMHS